jgi:hypothetical protein
LRLTDADAGATDFEAEPWPCDCGLRVSIREIAGIWLDYLDPTKYIWAGS